VLPLLHAVPKWNLLTDPLSLYGRRLCRTVTACCTGTTYLNVRALRMLVAADILTLFSNPDNAAPGSAAGARWGEKGGGGRSPVRNR
jgi:hypothetical protein